MPQVHYVPELLFTMKEIVKGLYGVEIEAPKPWPFKSVVCSRIRLTARHLSQESRGFTGGVPFQDTERFTSETN